MLEEVSDDDDGVVSSGEGEGGAFDPSSVTIQRGERAELARVEGLIIVLVEGSGSAEDE